MLYKVLSFFNTEELHKDILKILPRFPRRDETAFVVRQGWVQGGHMDVLERYGQR